jgi:hypothetical protein
VQAYLATHISPHLLRTKDGGLLAKDVVIARSGPMEYAPQELQIPERGPRVTVWREPEEITNRRFLASCEGAVVTDAHPTRFVDPGNYSYLARGHMQNARVGPLDDGGNATAVADLFIKDGGLAEKVESGAVRDVSIGYRLDLLKDHRGRYVQKNLEVNHCAVVSRGRGGSTKILDAAPEPAHVPAPRSLAEMASDYLGKPVASVTARAFDSKELTMNYEDDLIPVSKTRERKSARDGALKWLREIRPEVSKRGTRAMKEAWNGLYRAVRDGVDPEVALTNVRRQFSDRASTAEDVQRVADDFVRTCASYLGQDINQVANERKTRELRRALADSKTTTESFVNTCAAYLGAADIHEVERKLRKRD